MNTKLPWWIGGTALVVIAVGVGLLAWLRVADSRQFGQAYSVKTFSGTNYVFRVLTITAGKAETNCVLILSVRIENPHPVPLVLRREWFVMADHDKDYFQPVPTGNQTGTITIPAHGATENETLNYVVPDDTLTGQLAILVGHQYFALIKSDQPLSRALEKGQFVTFRQLNW